jgi:hypothetical protein
MNRCVPSPTRLAKKPITSLMRKRIVELAAAKPAQSVVVRRRFALAVAGLWGPELGFAETERQVAASGWPQQRLRPMSRAVVEQMKTDEAGHAQTAVMRRCPLPRR